MAEQRRARFGSIEGLEQPDFVLAGEVWLEDLMRAPWATKEAMKLGAQILRYLGTGDDRMLSLVVMETQLQLAREEVRRSLALMQSMNAAQTYGMEKDSINVILHLSRLQLLRTLETRQRLRTLVVASVPAPAAATVSELPARPAAAAIEPEGPATETRSAA